MTDKIIVVSGSSFGDYFRKLRENIGLTQSEVCRRTELSQQLISVLEKKGFRSGTRWDGVSKLLEFYAKNGSPSLFAIIYQNGRMIESFPEVYPRKMEAHEEIAAFKAQLKGLLEQIDRVDL